MKVAEADTTFLPDLTSVATIQAAGGFLAGAQDPAQYEFGAGPAVRPKPGVGSVFFPVDGLIAGDEFTLEYRQRIDSWAANNGKALFAIHSSRGGNMLDLFNVWNGIATFRASCLARDWSAAWSAPVSALGLTDGATNSFAVTLKNGILTFIINDVVRGQIAGVTWLPVWSDTTKDEGVLLHGEAGQQAPVWTSDVRISRTARVLGQDVPLRSTWSIKAGSTVDRALPKNFIGALKIGRWTSAGMASAMSVEDTKAALSVVREGDTITDTPIKAGPPDATHPTLGASGQFSYDWQVVDRSLRWYADRGLAVYLDADSTPNLLGGAKAPNPLVPLFGGNFNPQVPTDLDTFATIMADLVWHAAMVGVPVARLSNTNEPDLGTAFWTGTMAQNVSSFEKWSRAVKAMDPSARIGAGELASIGSEAWIDAFMAAKAAGAPMDFFAYHDYSGSLNTMDYARALVGKYAAARGTAPPPLTIGEFNWSDLNDEAGVARFRGGYWHVRALNAAYTTAALIHAIEGGGIEAVCWAHTGPSYNTIRSNQKYTSMILIGDNGEHWAPYNALKGWKQAIEGGDLLTATRDLPPGVHGLVVKNATGYGVALANWGWANRTNRTVQVDLTSLPAGSYRLRRYLVDETHSSRWDVAQDRPEGATHDALALVEDRVTSDLLLSVTLPRWSSTFITLEPSGSAPPPPPPSGGGSMLKTQHSFRGWFKTTTNGKLFGYNGPGTFRAWVNPRLMVELRTDTGTSVALDGVFGLDNDQWHQFAVVKDGLNVKLAWDGGGTGKVATKVLPSSVTASTLEAAGILVEQFEDLPDTVLTDAQILQHFQAGHGTPPPPPPSTDWQTRAEAAEAKLAQIHSISAP